MCACVCMCMCVYVCGRTHMCACVSGGDGRGGVHIITNQASQLKQTETGKHWNNNNNNNNNNKYISRALNPRTTETTDQSKSFNRPTNTEPLDISFSPSMTVNQPVSDW